MSGCLKILVSLHNYGGHLRDDKDSWSFDKMIYDDISGRCFADCVDTEPAGYKRFSVYFCVFVLNSNEDSITDKTERRKDE